jgi:hypothetical protein
LRDAGLTNSSLGSVVPVSELFRFAEALLAQPSDGVPGTSGVERVEQALRDQEAHFESVYAAHGAPEPAAPSWAEVAQWLHAAYDRPPQTPEVKAMLARVDAAQVDRAPSIYEQRLRSVLDVVRRYLPPDGMTPGEAMGEIIGLVDPWPDGVGACDEAHFEGCPNFVPPTTAEPEGFISEADLRKLRGGVAVTIYPGTITPGAVPLFAHGVDVPRAPSADRATCPAHGGDYHWTNDCPECVKDARERGMPIDAYYSSVRPTLRPPGVPGTFNDQQEKRDAS